MSFEDIAQEVELKQWEQNNQPRTGPARFAAGDEGYGPEFCEGPDCEQEMPTARREHGYRLCVACKTREEAIGRIRRR